MNFFNSLYTTADHDMEPFGSSWVGPDKLAHGERTLVARYLGEGDGQPVEVMCTAMPARFYQLVVLPHPNSVGEPQAGYEVHTGSGIACAKWAAETASLISMGMVSFKGGV